MTEMRRKIAYRRQYRKTLGGCESLESRILLSSDGLHFIPPFDFASSADSSTPLVAAAAAAADVAGPMDSPPILHSLPGAEAKVFLDFDGNLEPNWGGNVNVLTPAYDLDGEPTSFNVEEQRRIHEAWARVAEDFAPFNIDVTTEDPADAKTMLRQAITISQRTRTFYFRHQFTVKDASAVSELTMQLLRDDGAAVYLNGAEVVRDNLAPDAAFDDFANSATNNESQLRDFSIDASLLVDGDNVLAVEVHQASDTSSDVSFDLSLAGTVDGTPDEAIVALGSSWNYLDDGSDQGDAWRASSFDDASWPVDQAEFGYGDADEVTALRVRPDGSGRTRTFYFRHEFDVADAAGFSQLAIGLLRDDGAAVYLNGEEIVRDNLAESADFDDFAISSVGDEEESTFYESLIDADLLREGQNVLAVEVHQVSDTSSDVSFDLDLAAIDGEGSEQLLVAAGSDWKYLDDGTDQGTAWQGSAFDDAAWPYGTSQFGYGDAPGTVHVAIGSEDWFEDSAGGVAFVDSFDLDDRTVVYSFTNGAGRGAKNIAEVSSHEAGHAFGLRHQSSYDPDTGERTEEYNTGEGDWAPIMGVGYSRALTTWHDGQVGSQGTPQDDMSRIARAANGFGYRTDDHGSSIDTATTLLPDGGTIISAAGIIERNADQDMFAFTLAEGQSGISIQVEGAEFGANLDAVLEIRNQEDEIVAVADPSNSYNASLDEELEPGDYTVVVRNNGKYGRVGQYTLTGEVDEAPTLVELERLGAISPAASVSQRQFAVVNFAGDQDSFLVAAQDGEFLAAVVTPTSTRSRMTVGLAGVGEPIVGTRGDSVTLPLTEITADGTFEITVEGDRTTEYTIDIGVNVLYESGDTTAETPLSLDDSSRANRETLAVVGQSEMNSDTSRLIQSSSVWRYLDDGSDQGEAWRARDFDDAEWKSGPGELGYGDNDEQTEVDEDGSDGTRIRTFYFRHDFEVSDLTMLESLVLELKYDDGVAVYLNGQEVVRDNLASSAGFHDFASSTVDDEGTFRKYVLDATLLQSGSNVLAIEVHQTSDSSSDVSMNARLDLVRRLPAVDSFAFDVLPENALQPLSILLQGQDADFRNQVVEIVSSDGQNVLATSTHDNPSEFDLEISDWTAPSDGTYIVRVTSGVVGRYVLSVGGELVASKPGDANYDGQVNFTDFLILSVSFGTAGDWTAGDFDGDGQVTFSDFLVLSSNFGS